MPKPAGTSSDSSDDGDDKPTSTPGSFGGGGSSGGGLRKGIRKDGSGPSTEPVMQEGEDTRDLPPYPLPLFMIVKGDKNSGKTAQPAGLPRPFGGKTVFLTFDSATRPGIIGHHDEETLENIDIVDVVSPQPDNDYPGYDPNVPETAAAVLDEAMAWLEHWKAQGNVDNLIIDHAEFMHMDVSPSYVVHKELEGNPLADFKMNNWGTRTKVSKLFMAEALLVPEHAIVLTGYGKEPKMTYNKQKKEWTEEIQDPSWTKKWRKPAHVILEHGIEKIRQDDEKGFETEFYLEIESAKSEVHHLFPQGERFEMTGRDYSYFWDRRDQLEEAIEEGVADG